MNKLVVLLNIRTTHHQLAFIWEQWERTTEGFVQFENVSNDESISGADTQLTHRRIN